MAEPIGTEDGTIWLSVPETARHLGISERAVRKRIAVNALPAEREGGGPWRVQVSAADAAPRAVPSAAPGGPQGGTTSGTGAEPIEVAYRVAGEAVAEVALVPLATMVEELRGLADQLQEMSRRNETLALEVGMLRERQVGHEAQLVARDVALEAQGETIATQREALADRGALMTEQAETIAELRRRAEAAEAELSRRREEEADAAALFRQRVEQEHRNRAGMQDAQDGPGATERPSMGESAPAGVWGRLRRWWRRGDAGERGGAG